MKAVEESPNRKRAHHLSNSRTRSGINSPLSQFPATPLSETGPSVSGSFSHQSDPSYPYTNSAQPSYPPNSNSFDDEVDDFNEQSESGRSTPSTMARRGPSTRSLPAGERGEVSANGNRPRAQTEDSTSAVINNWRNQTPTDPTMPALPRGISSTSNGSDNHSLRSSASSRQLRQKPSTEWTKTSPAMEYSRLPTSHPQNYEEETTPRPSNPPRQSSSHSTIPQPPTNVVAPLLVRNRSASSPNIYQLPAPGSASLSQEEWSPYPEQPRSNQPIPSLPSSSSNFKSTSHSNGTLASASTKSTTKRSSSSSNGTDRSSGTSNQSQGQTYTASTSPATTIPGHHSHQFSNTRIYSDGGQSIAPPLPAASAVRVKVTYGDDTFVVVVLSSVSYRELLEKVLKKIRMCGDRTKVDDASLRLRYEDEDQDRILITSGEDVAMAFESARIGDGNNSTGTLLLYATVDFAS